MTDQNFHDLVQVTSIGRNGGQSLIEALRQVWQPTLEKSGVNPTSLKKLENELFGPKPATSISEEIDYWQSKRKEAKRSHEKKVYEEAMGTLRQIRAELESASISR